MSDQATQSGNFYKGQTDKINVPLRPFNRGIIRNTSPTMVPTGALVDANGYIPTTSGIERRPGFSIVTTIDAQDVTRYDYMNSFIGDDGSKIAYAIADGRFYELTGQTFIERPCAYLSTDDSPNSTIEASLGSYAIVGTNTTFTARSLIVGDYVQVDIGGTIYEYRVTAINSDTSLSIGSAVNPAIPAGSSFAVRRTLSPAAEWQVQVVRLDRLLYICTGQRPLVVYDIDNPDNVVPLDLERNFIPKCINVFNDRLWCGNIYIPGNYPSSGGQNIWYTNRISWSKIVAEAGYTPTASGGVDINPLRNFNDLVNIGGEVSSLATLGSYLLAFFEFGIEYGRETSVPGDTLPLAFDRIMTGRRGVLQPGAVVETKNGVFFVSTDNVYYVSDSLKVEAVSDTVNELLFRTALLKTRYKIHDFSHVDGLIIGACSNEDSYDEFWVLNLSTGAWTRFAYSCDYFNVFTLGSRDIYGTLPESQIFGVRPPGSNDDALGNPLPDSPAAGTLVPVAPPTDDPQVTLVDDPVNNLPGYSESDETYGGENSDQSNDRLTVTVGPNVLIMDMNASTDQNNAPIYCTLETGDFDFGRPDHNKTLYKIAVRLYNQAEADIVYAVQGSIDSGLTWWDLCDLTIFDEGKEGKSNFMLTGSAMRLRLTSHSEVPAYELVETTLDVKSRGRQFADT